MALRIESRGVRASIECGGRAHQAEYVLFHPTRGSVISVTSASLQEIDLATGALVGEIEYDLFPIVAAAAAPTSADKAHALDHLIAVGSYFVVGVHQSRYFIVWDLQEMVLQSISEVEKQLQKGMSAITGSLCRDHWLFYASDGSNSVKVTSVDSKEIPKKISRKASNRSSQLVSLAYSTSKRLLCCGSSDGSLQLWLFSEDNTLGGKDEAAMASLLFTTPAVQSPLVQLCFAANGMRSTYLIAGYQSRLVEVRHQNPEILSESRPLNCEFS
uniref:Uncharacterized protein n=1 Tax=Globisporangium ultimum (strain ATCC 200006 / CBS 805.95 / DAOM BR144) TaxID=431595 RepID=K3X254_GLOUD